MTVKGSLQVEIGACGALLGCQFFFSHEQQLTNRVHGGDIFTVWIGCVVGIIALRRHTGINADRL